MALSGSELRREGDACEERGRGTTRPPGLAQGLGQGFAFGPSLGEALVAQALALPWPEAHHQGITQATLW